MSLHLVRGLDNELDATGHADALEVPLLLSFDVIHAEGVNCMLDALNVHATHWPDIKLLYGTSHLKEGVQLHNAPEPLNVGRSPQDNNPLAACQVYGQATDVGLYIRLVDAILVNP